MTSLPAGLRHGWSGALVCGPVSRAARLEGNIVRARIRRMALVCAGALAIVPLSAGAASAQSPEDFCDEVPGELEPVFGPICEGLADDENGDENGDERRRPDRDAAR
jgi:hypothetical protein